MYCPRIKCLDCPGAVYTPGPETGVITFEVHVKNRKRREKVLRAQSVKAVTEWSGHIRCG